MICFFSQDRSEWKLCDCNCSDPLIQGLICTVFCFQLNESVKWLNWTLESVSEGKLGYLPCFRLQQVFLQIQTLLLPQGLQVEIFNKFVFVDVCIYDPGLNIQLPILGCSLIALDVSNCSERMLNGTKWCWQCQKKSKKC